MPIQSTYNTFKQHLTHRHLLYCHQRTDELQLTSLLKQFLIRYPQWQSQLAITHISSKRQQLDAIPFYHQDIPDISLVALADICLLIMKPEDQQKWLKEAYHHRQHDISTKNHPKQQYIILIDPSAPLLPPSPPLLPVDLYKIITIRHIHQIPSTLHSILSTLDNKPSAILPSYPTSLNLNQVIQSYQDAKNRRLFLFDYDGTLTPIVQRPEMALPSNALMNDLTMLSRDPLNTVWIISGRDRKFLHNCFGHLHALGLSAEHGSFMKMPGDTVWMEMLTEAMVLPWKRQALDIFSFYTQQLPGTEIEEKKSSITWHYRNAHDQQAALRKSHACHQALLDIPGVDVLVGKMNLEVKSVLVNKGNVVKRICQQQENADFVMCAGDDQTDEDMFKALYDTSAYTILVGPSNKLTLARTCVDSSHHVVDLLGQLVHNSSSL
ncbi:trehalose-phosphatase-domain-containing protein [Halteromyces radiatus]|uniref:trehalose-phosphatase-domain-containing protein n=1 Tax=Halteromyces radiatus TaxID=101107 RepID=UPI00221F91E3|nr:trehalose-phosphatase-domain-containing protein [Halteromyces radiatus]KAI8077687.1 trehalose-phosphatase-domain-containing protein [Halteromyces radiatus]